MLSPCKWDDMYVVAHLLKYPYDLFCIIIITKSSTTTRVAVALATTTATNTTTTTNTNAITNTSTTSNASLNFQAFTRKPDKVCLNTKALRN